MRLLRLAACAVLGLNAPHGQAAEGMWTFDRLPRAQMQAQYGFAPDAAWVDHVRRAAVLVRGRCSGSFVSSAGLVATNEHCVRECLGKLSAAAQDRVGDGFYAPALADERRCEGVEVDRLDAITDVTTRMDAAVGDRHGDARAAAAHAEQARIEAECTGQDGERTWCSVVTLYGSRVVDLYRYHRYADVRMVFAPELDIAAFGGDADNFRFPRYNFDVAFLRAYEDGHPAAVADWLPFAPQGAQAGAMTMVVGNPVDTHRGATVAQLETTRDDTLIMRIGQFSELRGTLTRYSREGETQRVAAQDDLHDFENALKEDKGEHAALSDPAAFERKRASEAALRRFVQSTPAFASTADAWDRIAAAQQVRRRTQQPYRMLEHGNAFFSRYFELARLLVRGAEERPKPASERLPEFADAALPDIEADVQATAPIDPQYQQMLLEFSLSKYRELVGADDPLVQQVFATDSPVSLAARLVARTKLGDVAVRKALWDGGAAAVERSDDPFIRLARLVDPPSRALRKVVEGQVEAVEDEAAARIAAASFAMRGGASYPDASFTLRLSYGAVEGWRENGEAVAPFTRTAGLYPRATSYAPLKLPARWVAAQSRLATTRQFNFLTSNDVFAGNSGSPVIDRQGELVGVMFDGNPYSLGNALWYDAGKSRAIAVDSGLVLEALAQVYGATRIVDELTAARR